MSEDYKKLFLSVLNEEDAGQDIPDSEVWASQNPDAGEAFNTKGVDKQKAEAYSAKIQSWMKDAEDMSNKLAEVHNFAAENATKTGADKIYSSIGNLISKITTDLGTLHGNLRTLDNKIRVTIRQDEIKKAAI